MTWPAWTAAPATVTEVVTHTGSMPASCSISAQQVDQLLRRARRLRCSIEPGLDGDIVVRRGFAVSIRLHPSGRSTLTATQACDLGRLSDRAAQLRVHGEDVEIRAGFSRIPPASARRLIARGWVCVPAVSDGARCTVSAAGIIGLTLRRHTTSTTAPRGWFHPSDDSRFRDWCAGLQSTRGRMYDGSSTAMCTCGWREPRDRRPAAAHAAKKHRLAELSTALVRHLDSLV